MENDSITTSREKEAEKFITLKLTKEPSQTAIKAEVKYKEVITISLLSLSRPSMARLEQIFLGKASLPPDDSSEQAIRFKFPLLQEGDVHYISLSNKREVENFHFVFGRYFKGQEIFSTLKGSKIQVNTRRLQKDSPNKGEISKTLAQNDFLKGVVRAGVRSTWLDKNFLPPAFGIMFFASAGVVIATGICLAIVLNLSITTPLILSAAGIFLGIVGLVLTIKCIFHRNVSPQK